MARSGLKFRVSLALALLLGLILRVWFIAHAGNVDGDGLLYGDIAHNWLDHGVYGFSVDLGPPRPTLIRLPGYPMFLAVCFRAFSHGSENYTAVMYVQAFADMLTCLLISALTGRLFGRRAFLAALWLSAVCPFSCGYTAVVLTESLSLFCIAAAFYAMERWRVAGANINRWLWAIAAALAYAVLLRPEQGLLAAAILPAMAWIALRGNRHKLTAALAPVILAAVCVILPLLPWTARNWRTFHVFQPLAPRYANDPGERVPLGFFRWYRTWAIDFADTENFYWNYNGAPMQISELPTRAFDSNQQYARTAALFAEYNQTTRDTPALNDGFAALAAERVHANPLRYYIALPVARLANMIFRPRTELLPIDLEWWKWSQHPRQTLDALQLAAVNLSYIILAGFGLRRWYRYQWSGNAALAGAMIASILLRCALLLTIDNSEPRYTLEFFPVLIVFAGAIFASRQRLNPALANQ